jgi:hypothetical protein
MAAASVPRPINRVGHSLLISAEPFSPASPKFVIHWCRLIILKRISL